MFLNGIAIGVSRILCVLALWCVASPAALAASQTAAAEPLALMPYPQSVQRQQGQLNITGPLRFDAASATTERARQGLQRLNAALAERPGIAPETAGQSIALRPMAAEHDTIPAPAAELERANEAYKLTLNNHGITIAAATDLGVLHALTSLLQLAGETGPVQLPYVTIEDAPRFAWRGVLLDSVRHFLPVAAIKRQLDGMAAAKLNVMHWHLTDDQGWRFESSAYPKLTELAANGQFYTRAQIKAVIAYAHERGIYVLPEVDMPGHASAIAVAYPELMSAPGPYQPEDRWGVHKPLLNPANKAVYTFAETILQEVSELFPFSYVHIGGDEVDPEHWENNEQIQAFMAKHKLADAHALHTYFNARLAKVLAGLNRSMIGWDEVLHPDLPEDTVVQSWRGPDALGRAVNAGHPALLSTGFYLDQPQSSAYHYRVRLEPQPLALDVTPEPDERWRSWRFTMPRQRGSDVAGMLSVIGEGESLRGFVDFKGKSRAPVTDLHWQDDQLSFALDSWMGPLQAQLHIAAEGLSGPVLAANAPYALTGELVASSELNGARLPAAIHKDIIEPQNKHLLLGGEVALWAEMVTPDNIDIRLWPRAFVVAERLWSSRDLRDEASMYQRLDWVSPWAAHVVGLQHLTQQRQGLSQQVPESQRELALALSRVLEPAQYYHRHHEKSRNETYSRRDALDNFVDFLPAESRAVQKFAQQLAHWQRHRDDQAAQALLLAQLTRWRDNARALQEQLQQHDPAELLPLAQSVQLVSDWGLRLVAAEAGEKPLTSAERQQAKRDLHRAMGIQQEMIVAPARVLVTLL